MNIAVLDANLQSAQCKLAWEDNEEEYEDFYDWGDDAAADSPAGASEVHTLRCSLVSKAAVLQPRSGPCSCTDTGLPAGLPALLHCSLQTPSATWTLQLSPRARLNINDRP